MKRRILWMLPAAAAAAALAAVGLADSGGSSFTSVPAQIKAAGYAPTNVLSPELRQTMVAQGSMRLDGAQDPFGWYGYINTAPSPDNPALPQMVPATAVSPTEAQKTEPDKNTYLVLPGQTGADPGYDYGTHFLFQGHEVGASINGVRQSLITRINLDADVAHRVTLLATKDSTGAPIQGDRRLDVGSVGEAASLHDGEQRSTDVRCDSGVSVDRHGRVGCARPRRLRGHPERLGRQHLDRRGRRRTEQGARRLRSSRTASSTGTCRSSPGDLQNGKLQVLQVWRDGHPVTFESQAALKAPDQVALRTYGTSFKTKWVTIHDTAVDGNAPFAANPLAKTAQGTPFKRPENGQFRPGSKFTQFFFDETGDTNATSPENGDPTTGAGGAGGWTSIFKLVQKDPSADAGTLSLFYKGNESVAGLDNVTFLSHDLVDVRRGRRRHAARRSAKPWTPASSRRDEGLLERRTAGALARRGSRSFSDARLRVRRLRRERRRQRDHRRPRLER